ncbi:MAG: TonB-dependent receptor plug domain-containing protein [Spirochaetaceae bacterium]|jgi:hypothetical protein|nr:TonB-dependent receptor plug domain-containing protein [Spirochaetaceae bacterium]
MLFTGKKKLLLGITVFFIAVFSLFSREVEILVEDLDLGLPLEGALIRSWDGKEYPCDKEGRVVLTVPDDRPVLIQGAYPGYENGRLLVNLDRDRFTLSLKLSGIMESRELVIETSRPGISETQTGRSVAVSEREIARTGEIGVIEDVMTTIKLLPGVGYSGMFNAMPSIRGGSPGDLMAVLDGFYIENPYHWGGGFSIFDPRMLQSAQLSHGVFSARYGHTISGILEISSKKPSPTETELEVAVSTSATNFNLSVPLFGKGGVMVMGRTTYYDPAIWAAKQLAKSIDELEVVNYIRKAPYIRNVALNANYRFTGDLEVQTAGFFGADGVGVFFENKTKTNRMTTRTDMTFDWENRLGFFSAGLTWNLRNTMVLRALAGAGFQQQFIEGGIDNDITVKYSDSFPDSLKGGKETYSLAEQDTLINGVSTMANYQGRLDFDWDLGRGFVFALGAQELYSRWTADQSMSTWTNVIDPALSPPHYVNKYIETVIDVNSRQYSSSAYTLLEYSREDKKFGAELGLRLDHLYFAGKDFDVQTKPAWNPRLNLDFGILQNRGPIDSFSLTLGTGLFSSRYDGLDALEKGMGIGDFDLKPNRSLTSILGARIDFSRGISFNIEGYYKYIFDRAYTSTGVASGASTVERKLLFDGIGHVGGFDFQLQKMASRYWDGWISYSFNYARYRDPHAAPEGIDLNEDSGRGNNWYYPDFHRFHTLNLVLNYKPVKTINIYTRFGLASGAPLNKAGEKRSIPVQRLNKDGSPTTEWIEIWTRDSRYSDTNRTTWSIPLDIKLSIFGFNRSGKAQYEVYVAVEGALSLLGAGRGNTSFNSYTGEDDSGSMSATYEIPIPILSFGFRWSY